MKKKLIFSIIAVLILVLSTDCYAGKSVVKRTVVDNTFNTPVQTEDLREFNKSVADDLIRAMKVKRLIMPDYIKEYIIQLSKNGYCTLKDRPKSKTYASRELLNLLRYLAIAPETSSLKPFSILSLFRYGSRAHAEVQPNGDIIGRAVDINAYAGYKINMNNPQMALEAIVRIINKLPKATYTIGLPRPGGGKLIDPEHDFFLPVKNLSQNVKSPTGNLKGDLNLIVNPEAKERITEAIQKNKNARILFMMPDAVDHVHIKAYDSK